MKTNNSPRASDHNNLYRASARSWDEKFATGRHYATDRPFEGLREVIDELRQRKIEHLLDVGCGNGRNLGLLAEAAAHVYGVDLAERALRKILPPPGQERRAGLVLGDVGRLPFRDRSVDAVVNVWTMNHGTHDEIRRYVAEMERVLRPGGVLFASVTAWSLFLAPVMFLFGRKIVDSSPDGHTYFLRLPNEEGVHHLFTRREILAYFGEWRILRLRRARHRAEALVRVPFWNVLAQKC